MALGMAMAAGCRQPNPPDQATPASLATSIPRGGRIVVSVRNEPRSFNRLMQRDAATELVATLTQAKLVRINRATQEVEPWLAESWTRSSDGLQYTVKLRPGLTYSDGEPFTSADVVFTFDALYDAVAGSMLADSLQAGGKPLKVTAPDPLTVVVTFAVPFAPGLRILDNLPILPKHKLQAALAAGTFATAWGLSTPPSALAGLGPFVLAEYIPGQRLVFNRNPRYFRHEHGAPLPYLDGVTVEIIPDQAAELLRLEAGQLDTMTSEIAPEAYAPLKRAADQGRLRLLDLGMGYGADSFWMNLKPGAPLMQGRAAWLQSDELRRAISLAVDRKAFADTVFFGAGLPVYGPVTEANAAWYWPDTPKTPHDPAAAKQLLASIGLVDRDDDGVLDDGGGHPVRFTLLTQKGRPDLERGASVIRDELKRIGVVVDVVAIDPGALIQRIGTAQYEAIYFTILPSDTDPAINPDFWFSNGSAHVWNLSQKTPATAWERRIDELMARQVMSPDVAERRQLFNEVQKVFAEHLPIVYFAAPRVFVAASSRLTNLTPALSRPQLLWAPDTMAVGR